MTNKEATGGETMEWRDALDALMSEIRACHPLDVLGVGTVLLRCMAGFERELYARVDDRAHEGFRRAVENACARVFESVDGEVVFPAHVDELEMILKNALAGIEHGGDERVRIALAVHAAGDALDHVLGKHFAGCLQARCKSGTLRLRAGDGIALCNPPLKKLMGSLNPRRDSLEPRSGRLRQLALVPESVFEVMVHVDRARVLDRALQNGRAVATALPLDSVDDLHWEDAPSSFSNVRPRKAAETHSAIIQLFEAAAERGVSVLVLPELCLEGERCDEVHAWLRTEHELLVVAAGSAHVRDGEGSPWKNRAHVFLGGREAFAHDKNNRFKLKRNGQEQIEEIETEPLAVTVVLSGEWSMTTVICKDLLSAKLDRLLGDLFVKVVLVPSCSPNLDDFVVPAQSLTEQAQALVAVANIAGVRPTGAASSDHDLQVSLIAFPKKELRKRVLTASRQDAPAPVLVLRAFDGSVLSIAPLEKA